MNLVVVEIALPLRSPIVTAYGEVGERHTILVGVEDGPLIGWGEAAPFPGADAESTDDVWHALVEDTPLPPTASAALSTALTDLAARREGTALAVGVGATGSAPVASLAIGAGDVDRTLGDAERAVELGCGAVKLKVGPGDAERITAVTARFPGLTVGADANGSLSDEGQALAFEHAGAAYLEQPFDPAALAAHARLRERTSTMEVVLDETIRSAADAERVFAAGAADRICLKPGRLGIDAVVELAARAGAHGVGIKIGGMFESAVGRSVVHALAGLRGSRFDDAAPDGAYFTEDVGQAVGGGAGIGFDPDADRLTLRRARVPLSPGRGTVRA
ncbi:MAG TPA: enolase C-terminal domain-like protein [Acidimicrobiia bacterium]|nr:enolase C-terminal domain-like protein [Acidimicrobiia bacterium]